MRERIGQNYVFALLLFLTNKAWHHSLPSLKFNN